MNDETAFAVALLEIERQIDECKKTLESKELKENKELYGQCKELLSDLEELKTLFDEHEETKYKRWGSFRRKKIQLKLVKKVFVLKRKYKPIVERINQIVGD